MRVGCSIIFPCAASKLDWQNMIVSLLKHYRRGRTECGRARREDGNKNSR